MRKIIFILLALAFLISCKKDETKPGPTIVYQDDLTSNKNTWATDSTSVHLRKFYQGHYLLKVDSVPNIITYSFAPFGTLNYPYSIQVDAMMQIDNSDMIGEVGMIFNRIDKNNYCIVEISNNGTYRIWQRINGNITSIISSTLNPVIRSGLSVKNTIKIIQSSTSVQLLINNTSIGTYNLSIPNTFFQVGVTTATYLVPVTGLFNNFMIEKI